MTAGTPEPTRDPEQLLQLLRERDVVIAEQQALIARLERNVEVFKRLAFGPSSEKRSPAVAADDARQGHLFAAQLIAEAEQVARETNVHGAIELTQQARPRKKAKRRKQFPEHVPQFTTTYELPESERVCSCGATLEELGEDETKELERVETTIVHVIKRKKYGCLSCGSTAKTAAGPPRVIEKGLLGPGFLSHVIVERFLNHMPYHRQEKKYESEGLTVTRSVLERSAARCAELLRPIYQRIGQQTISGEVIFTDDTPVKLARSSKGTPSKSRIWGYFDLEGRHFYDFTESRKRDGPLKLLGDYCGYIHADAYTGYDRLFIPGGAKEVACWAHTRRKFLAAESSEPDLAKEAIDRIGALYGIEREAKDRKLTASERHELRLARSRPLLDEFAAWMAQAETQVLPKSPLAEALTYTRNQWPALQAYLDDGRLEIDNNRSERGVRPFAVGRANWSCFQTSNGGETAALLMTLVRTARAVGIDPKVYLRDVLLRIHFESDVEKLTPHGWKQHFADQVTRDHRGAVRVLLPSVDAESSE